MLLTTNSFPLLTRRLSTKKLFLYYVFNKFYTLQLFHLIVMILDPLFSYVCFEHYQICNSVLQNISRINLLLYIFSKISLTTLKILTQLSISTKIFHFQAIHCINLNWTQSLFLTLCNGSVYFDTWRVIGRIAENKTSLYFHPRHRWKNGRKRL